MVTRDELIEQTARAIAESVGCPNVDRNWGSFKAHATTVLATIGKTAVVVPREAQASDKLQILVACAAAGAQQIKPVDVERLYRAIVATADLSC